MEQIKLDEFIHDRSLYNGGVILISLMRGSQALWVYSHWGFTK